MYKLLKDFLLTKETMVLRVSDNACIPFDPANTDFANFKKDILDGAELQDAEGNTMSAEQATQFVKELP